ncbi:MAG: CRISPR-associated endonuclease Cas1 [Bacteroidales bacterium]|nr:CRISPR-associated endonuclease Cas1 [Bacteroidales bacterium]
MRIHINTYGTYIHIKEEMFEIRVPQEDKSIKKTHLAAHKVTSIILSKGGALSTDAIFLAVKNNIDIIVLDEFGQPIGRFWHSKLGSTTKIRKKQLEITGNQFGVEAIKQWLNRKLSNKVEFLKDLKKHRKSQADYIQEQINKIENQNQKIIEIEANDIKEIDGTLRGLEGTAGRIYFEVLNNLLTDQYKFNGRNMRPAKDQFNAFLNYAYGVLYSRIEKALMIAGIDPYVGIMHRDDYNQKSMVFDFIEPYRTYCEEVVFRLFSGKKVNKNHTDKITNGISLNKEGKELLLEKLIYFLDEQQIRYKGKNQVRNNIIQLEAHAFAQEILKQ